MSSVLVTGSSGYIGSNLIRRLGPIYNTKPVMGLDLVEGEFTNFVADMIDKASLYKIIAIAKPAAVIHLAALIQVGESEQKPAEYWNNNFVATLNLLDVIRQTNPEIKLIFMSSAAVYGHSEIPLSVDHGETNPVSVYGHTKLACERAIRSYCESYNMKVAIIRLFNIGGGIRNPDETFHLIPIALKRLQNEGTFSIFGCDYDTEDGTCVRSYVHVYDLIDTCTNILEMLLSLVSEWGHSYTYNVSAEEHHSVLDIVKSIIEFTQQKLKVRVKDRRPGDPGKLVGELSDTDRTVVVCDHNLKDIIKDEWNSRIGISEEISGTSEK